MDLNELEERWRRMLAQAEQFVHVDNTVDALGRARLCLREAEAELAKAGDPEAKTRLAKMAARATRHVELCQKAHDEWCASVQNRADQYQSNEKEKYHAELPVKGID